MVRSEADNLKVNVPYDDLRQWMAEADKLGELKRANGYTWQEQIGMAAELLQHERMNLLRLLDLGLLRREDEIGAAADGIRCTGSERHDRRNSEQCSARKTT